MPSTRDIEFADLYHKVVDVEAGASHITALAAHLSLPVHRDHRSIDSFILRRRWDCPYRPLAYWNCPPRLPPIDVQIYLPSEKHANDCSIVTAAGLLAWLQRFRRDRTVKESKRGLRPTKLDVKWDIVAQAERLHRGYNELY